LAGKVECLPSFFEHPLRMLDILGQSENEVSSLDTVRNLD